MLSFSRFLASRAAAAWVCTLGTAIVSALALAGDERPPLPRTPEEALRAERSTALPIDRFYDTPASLGASGPGSLISQEVAMSYSLPPGVRAVRILYHSKDAAGADVDS